MSNILLENDLNTENISISENYREFIQLFNDEKEQAHRCHNATWGEIRFQRTNTEIWGK